MMDKHDPLEAELQALRPQPIRAELQERIASSLAAERIATSRLSLQRRLVVFGGLVAASVLLTILGLRGYRARIIHIPNSRSVMEVADPLPTFRAYQHALDQSPEAAEALLDKYAARTLVANHSSTPVRPFRFTDTDLPD
jgi:hypothetical protein